MRALAFAWRSVTRRRAQSALGILGIAAAGALTFDMLLLSRGLLVSVRQLLDSIAFDVRVMASEGMPQSRAPLEHAFDTARTLARLPEVAAAVPFRAGEAETATPGRPPASFSIFALGAGDQRMWTLLDGTELPDADNPDDLAVVVNSALAARLGATPGAVVQMRGRCDRGPSILPAVPEHRGRGVVSGRVRRPTHGRSALCATGPAVRGHLGPC